MRRMWAYPKMILLFVAVTAAFALVSLFCADFTLIPGYSAVRPVNGLPVTMGLMFGPAGALGCAAGNALGDIFRGELGWTSIAGAAGNFLFAWLPYTGWDALRRQHGRSIPNIFSWRRLLWFAVFTALGAVVCALIVATGIVLASGDPWPASFLLILENNLLGGYIVGIPLFLVLPIFINWADLYWKVVMRRPWD